MMKTRKLLKFSLLFPFYCILNFFKVKLKEIFLADTDPLKSILLVSFWKLNFLSQVIDAVKPSFTFLLLRILTLEYFDMF